MIDATFAQQFAEEWLRAWNAHHLEAILAHYTDDFEMSSPFIVERMQEHYDLDAAGLDGGLALSDFGASVCCSGSSVSDRSRFQGSSSVGSFSGALTVIA